MKKTNWLYVVVIAAIIVGCKKVPLPVLPDGNNPIYTMIGEVGGENIKWNVGEDNIGLKYGVSDLNGVPTYYGEIQSLADDEIIRIDIVRPEKPRVGGEIVIFKNDSIPFLVHELGKVTFDFGGFGNESNNIKIWDPVLGNFIANDKKEIEQFGYVNYRARFEDSGSEYTFDIKHGFQDQTLVSVFDVQSLLDTIKLSGNDNSNSHIWYIDGVLVGTDITYTGSITDGIHKITHFVIDDQGNESFTNGLVRYKHGKKFWDMKVLYDAENEFEPNNYGRVIVSMYKDGQWYSSQNSESNMGQNMIVDSVKFVPNNYGTLPTVSFDFDFSTTLFNENMTESLVLSNVYGKFMVGLE